MCNDKKDVFIDTYTVLVLRQYEKLTYRYEPKKPNLVDKTKSCL